MVFMKWNVGYYSLRVKEDIQDWPPNILAKYLRIVDLIEKLGLEKMGMPHINPMGQGLFEIRAKGSEGIGRALFCTKKGQVVIILCGFIKKTQKTPQRELELARKRMKEIL